MDAMHVHWNEWGFPGSDMLHLHSTPLQLAFDRGLPALLFWLWICGCFGVLRVTGKNIGAKLEIQTAMGFCSVALARWPGFLPVH